MAHARRFRWGLLVLFGSGWFFTSVPRAGIPLTGYVEAAPAGTLQTRCGAAQRPEPGQYVPLRSLEPERSAVPTPASPLTHEKVGIRIPAGVTFGSYHALVIGNDAYRQLEPLKAAENDARAVAAILEHDYGFKVRLLLNATRSDMLSAVNEMHEHLAEKDNLLVYYAGRGELDERKRHGYWLPIDADPNSSANWISTKDITDIIKRMRVQQLLLVIDTCYSGSVTRLPHARLAGGLSEEEQIKLILAMAKRRARLAMTSGGVEPVFDSTEGRRSTFAEAFVDVLRQNVGVLPGSEVFRYVRERVVKEAARVNLRQVPDYGPIKFADHEWGDFFFVRVSK